jgi:Tol biopolymer transport system component
VACGTFEPNLPPVSRIVFHSFTETGVDLFTVIPVGTERRVVGDAIGMQPTWAPDGESLAFVRFLGGVETGLPIINRDGTGEIELTDPRPGADRDEFPERSADGRHIVFTRTNLAGVDYTATLWVVRPDGTGLRQITNAPRKAFQPSQVPGRHRDRIQQLQQRRQRSLELCDTGGCRDPDHREQSGACE